MPPRGRKAFVSRSAAAARAAAAGSDSDEDKATKAEATTIDDKPIDGATATDAADEKKASAAPVPPSAPAPAAGSDGEDDDDSRGGKETRGQMIQRHKRETKAQKEASKRLGKKKKDEAAAAEAALLARHEAELKALDDDEATAAGGQSSSGAAAAAAAAADSLSRFKLYEREDEKQLPNLRKGSKAARRRAERIERDAEREARKDEERAAVAGTGAGTLEEKELRERVLVPLGLEMVEVPADGHCLYAALSHQLKLVIERRGDEGEATSPPPFEATVSSLRALAAKHIREHASAFEPFIDDDELDGGGGGGEGEEEEEVEQKTKIERYCQRLEATAAWGGQPELQALAEALPAKIKVLSAGMDPVVVEGGSGEKKEVPELTICYLRHAFGLGEHYNSTVAASAADDDASSGEENDEKEAAEEGVDDEER